MGRVYGTGLWDGSIGRVYGTSPWDGSMGRVYGTFHYHTSYWFNFLLWRRMKAIISSCMTCDACWWFYVTIFDCSYGCYHHHLDEDKWYDKCTDEIYNQKYTHTTRYRESICVRLPFSKNANIFIYLYFKSKAVRKISNLFAYEICFHKLPYENE